MSACGQFCLGYVIKVEVFTEFVKNETFKSLKRPL